LVRQGEFEVIQRAVLDHESIRNNAQLQESHFHFHTWHTSAQLSTVT
jgi:hypothetical protein